MAITILCCHSVILYRVHFAISGIRTHALIAKCKSNYHTITTMTTQEVYHKKHVWIWQSLIRYGYIGTKIKKFKFVWKKTWIL